MPSWLDATTYKLSLMVVFGMSRRAFFTTLIMGIVLATMGVWALDLQARQARDTKRKLDLEDLETALNRVLARTGTLPPESETTWCGVVSAPESSTVRDAIEASLRETRKYFKAEKPFPADPRFAGTGKEYAYWKTSPVSFELLAELEADRNNSRPLDLASCELQPRGTSKEGYDYALISVQRNPP